MAAQFLMQAFQNDKTNSLGKLWRRQENHFTYRDDHINVFILIKTMLQIRWMVLEELNYPNQTSYFINLDKCIVSFA